MKNDTQARISVATVRLFLMFLVVAFSFGGFTFYAAVVVPIGSDVLDTTTQGFVTQRVTHVINAASAVALAMFAWECRAAWPQRKRWENRAFVGLLAVLCLSLAGLLLLHPQLDRLLSVDDFAVSEGERFYALHQAYLWTSTLQWLATLGVIGLICLTTRR